MSRLRLIHWNSAQAERYIKILEGAGHRVEYFPEFSPQLMREWRKSPPDAFVIDLSRLPSQGREIVIALRQSKNTRAVPILFCEGEEEKVAKTRAVLPDALFCPLTRLRIAVRQLKKSTAPVVPVAMMDRYGSRTAAQKLGIREGDVVLLVDPPRDMPGGLGELPPSVNFVESLPAAVTLLFATDPQVFLQQLSEWRSSAAKTKLWVCWKKGRLVGSGVSERLVRETGISLGLVDYKICAINSVWSGLLFSYKASRASK
jgi:CheY-like chemotaxis protein